MQQASNEFLERLNNRNKERQTCLITFLGGRIDGQVVTDLRPAEEWCFDPDQAWNKCYTARYRADAKGAVVAPLIRQLVRDMAATGAAPQAASKMAQSAANAPAVAPRSVGVIRKAEGVDWGRLEEGLRGVDVRPTVTDADVLRACGSILRSVLETGQRLVLFCEITPEIREGHEPNVATLGLDSQTVGAILEVLPERCALVFAGVTEISPYVIHEGIARIALPPDYLVARPPEDRSQPLASDRAQGTDALNVQSEVNALADAIAAKDMDPPLVLGILGGWGAGKSFVLHLLEQRLLAIRRKNVRDPRVQASHPYVGHFYLVRFDAWTYAKADLWSSLMQEVLLALNDQIAYEQLSVGRRPEWQADIDQLKRIEDALGQKEAFDEEAVGTFVAGIPQRGRPDEEDIPSPADLTEEYLELKRGLFEKRFARLLTGEDDFSADVVAMITRDDADARRILVNLDNDVLWSRLQGLNARLQEELAKEEERLRQEKVILAEDEAKLAQEVDLELRRGRWAAYAAGLAGVLGKRFKEAVEKRLADAKVDQGIPFDEAIESVGVVTKVVNGRSGRTLVAFVAFALAGVGVALLAERAAAEWMGLSGLLGGLLGSIVESWGRANRWMKTRADEFKAFEEDVQTKEKTRREALIARAAAAKDHQAKVKEVAELESKVEAYRRRIGLTAGHATLMEFIAARLEEGGYAERLGLLQQVQQDIRQLTEGLLSKALCIRQGVVDRRTDLERVLFPRGLPRVVLFIDDLDRCPPTRVVEVLEAAQLLVKTRLFVVVMAMDVRYITKALEKAYAGVLDRRGDPSGLDYIEKIVQIPYRIRPISKEAMPGYLRSQMQFTAIETPGPDGPSAPEGPQSVISAPGEGTVRIDETIPQEVLAFDEDELKLIENAALAVDTGPRATKRLVNVLKLIKIIWYRTGEDSVPLDIEQTIIFFLALSARHAGVMRWVLLELEKVAAHPGEKAYDRKLPGLLGEVVKVWGGVDGRSTEWEFLLEASKNGALLPQEMTIATLGARNLELIRSFSFVGEVDLPPEPGTHQVSLQVREPVRIARDGPLADRGA